MTLQVDGLVCDLDGVVYRGAEPVPGAADAIGRLRAAGIPIAFATNNATATVDAYVRRLAGVGIEATPHDVVTSAVVTAEEVVRRGLADRTCFVLGGAGITAALADAGVRLVEGEEARTAGIVVVSGAPHLSYDLLRTAAMAARAGAVLLATNADPTFPAPDGLWPGAGAIVAAVEVASGCTAEVLGKPHRPMLEAAARRLGGHRRLAVVGDQPGTDLDGGRALGWATVLVLSGVTDAEAAARLEPPPDLVLASIADLPQALGV